MNSGKEKMNQGRAISNRPLASRWRRSSDRHYWISASPLVWLIFSSGCVIWYF